MVTNRTLSPGSRWTAWGLRAHHNPAVQTRPAAVSAATARASMIFKPKLRLSLVEIAANEATTSEHP